MEVRSITPTVSSDVEGDVPRLSSSLSPFPLPLLTLLCAPNPSQEQFLDAKKMSFKKRRRKNSKRLKGNRQVRFQTHRIDR